MGNIAAIDMADQAGVNEVTIGWHLQHNHYPPLSSRLIQPALAAIEAYNEEDPNREIDLGGTLQNGKTKLEAWRLVDGLHLHAFIGVGVEVEL